MVMSKIILALYVLATSFALVCIKLSTKTGAPVHYADNRLQFNINFYTVAGITLYGLSFAIYIFLISKYELGYILPLTTAFVYVLIFIASFFIFHEAFTVVKVIGIALIMSGVVLLNLKK
jgi:small multidrug resistance pump